MMTSRNPTDRLKKLVETFPKITITVVADLVDVARFVDSFRMRRIRYRASRSIPWIVDDARENWKSSPRKYSPATSETPRQCRGRPASSKAGRSIQL